MEHLYIRIRSFLFLFVVFFLLVGTKAQAQFTITNNFKGSSASGITVGPVAVLTSGTADPVNNGWLRLTPTLASQRGFAYINQTFPSTLGVLADFEYKTWSDKADSYGGADGFCVFLFDGAVAPGNFQLGGLGGSLGYANNNATIPATPGMTGGYVGIGFDEYGNYGTSNEGRNGAINGTTLSKSSIILRGPTTTTVPPTPNTTTNAYLSGVVSPTGFPISYKTITATRPTDAQFYRRVQIEILKTGANYTINIRWATTPGGTFVTLTSYVLTSPPPPTLRIGFVASTGGGWNYHEIRNLVVTTPGGVRVDKTVDKSSALVGDQLTYTVNAYNSTPASLSGLILADTIKNNDNSTVSVPANFAISSITFNNNGFAGNTSSGGYVNGVPKTTGFTNPFNVSLSMAANSVSTFSIVGNIITPPIGGVLKNSTGVDPTATGITDTDLTNNYFTTTTNVLSPNVDFTISKTVDNSCGSPGANNTYTILVSNNGATASVAGQKVTVTDVIPSGFVVSTANPPAGSGWTITNSGSTYTFTRTDALASGFQYPPITIVAAAPSTGTSWTNTATVAYAGPESNTSNNTASVIVYAKSAAPTVTSPVVYCQGATAVALTAVGTNLKWYTLAVGGAASTTAPVPSTATVGSTTYYVSQSNGTCESPLTPITVTIQPSLAGNTIGAAQAICPGTAPAALTGSTPTGGTGTYTYLWEQSTDGGTTWATVSGTSNGINYPPGALSATTLYRRTVTSGSCVLVSTPLTITVQAPIVGNTITNTPPLTVCSGTAVPQLTGATPTGGSGTYTYQWQVSTTSATAGFAPAAGTNNTINYTPASLTVTSWFTRVVTSGTCTNTSPAIQVTVNTAPTTSVAGPAQSLCQVTSTTLAGNVPAAGAGSGLWSQISGPAATITTPASNNTTVTGLTPGIYVFRWTISNGVCTPSTSDVQVTVNATPRASNAGTNQTLCAATTTTLAGNASVTAGDGTGAWAQVSGPNTATITNSALNNTTVTGLIPGTYVFSWTISNGSCAPTTSNVQVTINPAIATNTITSSPTTVCSGAAVAQLTGSQPTGGPPASYSYYWESSTTSATAGFAAAPGTNNTINYTSGPLTATTWFRRTVILGACTDVSPAIQVTVSPTPTASNAGPDQALCQVTSITLAGNMAAVGTGTWSMVSGQAGANITNPNQNNTTVTGLLPGIYVFRWSISSGVCPPSTDDVQVTIYANPRTANAGPNQTLCNVTTTTLAGNASVTAGDGTGTWTQVSGPNTATITNAALNNTTITGMVTGSYVFRWTVSNGNCPPSTSDVTINNLATPSTANAGPDLTQNNSGSFTMQANAPVVGIGMWTVKPGSTATIADPTNKNTTVTIAPNTTATLIWTISNGPCAASSDEVVISYVSQAGIQVVKSVVDPGPYVAGAPISYRIVVTNNGPSDASGVKIIDVIPADFNISNLAVTASGTAAVVQNSSIGGLVNVTANITAGAGNSIIITATGTISSNYSGTLTNTAAGNSPVVPDPNGPATSTVNTPVTRNPQLILVKQGPSNIIAGQNIAYTVTISNLGTGDAIGTAFADAVPSQITNVAWTVVKTNNASFTGTGSGTGNAINFTGSIPAGAGNTLVLNVTGTVSPSATGSFTNTATATPAEPVPAVNSNTITTNISSKTGLVMLKNGPATAQAGAVVSYTLTVTNNGLSDAFNASITDAVPPTLKNVSWTAAVQGGATVSATSGTGNTVSLSGNIPTGPGNVVTVTIIGTVDPAFSGNITNTATATPSETGGTASSSTVSTTVSRTPVVNITKTGPATLTAGQTISYTIQATNTSLSDAKSLAITDNVPAQITNVNWVASVSGSANVVTTSGIGNAITVNGNLPAGAANKITITVTGVVASSFSGSLVNTATVTPSEPNTTANTATSTTVVSRVPVLAIQKTGPVSVTSGQPLTYTVEVTNTGLSDANLAAIADVVPASLTNISWSTAVQGNAVVNSGGTGSNSNNVAVSASIPAGAANKVIVTITGTLDASFSGVLTNTATATASETGVSVSSTATTTASRIPVITLTKSGPSAIISGQQITYTIQATNLSTSNAKSLNITDQVPAQISNVNWNASITGSATLLAPVSGTGNAISITGDLPAGSANGITITVTGTVDPAFNGNISNSAVATPAEPGTIAVTATSATAVNKTPTVAIQKIGPSAISAGEPITYTLVVNNTGTANADVVNIQDLIPASISNVKWLTNVGGAATITAGGTGSSNTVNLTANIPAGAANTVTVTITGTVNPAFTGTIVNTANVTPQGQPLVPSNTTNTTVSNDPGIVVSKSGPASISAGGQISYTIQVTNSGPSNATAVAIADQIPAAVLNPSWTATAAGTGTTVSLPSGTGNVNITGDIPAGAGNVVTINVTGQVDPAFVGSLVNNVTATAPGKTPATATATTNVTNDPNVQITKSGPVALSAGQNISYTLTISNSGSSNANNVAITDVIPPGIQGATWSAVPAGTATVSAPSGTGNVILTGNIPAGAANVITVIVNGKIDPSFAPGNLVNTAVATPAGKTPVTSNPVTTVVTSDPNIMVVKSGPDNVSAGTVVTYTIKVTNAGVSDASNVAIADVVPSGLINASWTAAATGIGVTVSAPNGIGNVNLTGNLPAGPGVITITLKGTIDPAYIGTMTNTATGTVPGKTPASGTKNTTVTNDPVIAIQKNGPVTIAAGQPITYTLTVSNTGPSNASNVAIADQIPAGLNNVTWTAVASGTGTTVSVAGGSGNVALNGNIPAGAGKSITVTINGIVDPAFSGTTILNTGTATAPGKPAVSSNVSTTITKISDLQIVKSGPQTVVAGQQVSYNITVTNAGPSDAIGAVIKDQLPPQLLNTNWTVNTTGAGTTASVSTGTGDINITGTIPAGPGNSIVIAVTGKLDPATTIASISNTATAVPATGTTDPTPATSTVVSTVGKQADLVIVKTGPADKAAGQKINYQLLVTNNGPSDVPGAVIVDAIPNQITGITFNTIVNGTARVVSSTLNGQILTITGNIPAGAGNSILVNINGTVNGAASPGSFTNTATVATPAGITETIPATNTSSILTNINTDVGLQISKSGPAEANIGDQIVYKIALSNTGSSDASGVAFSDPVPPEITNVNWTAVTTGNGGTTVSASSGSGNNIALTANIEGTTNGPGEVMITVTGTVSPAAGSSITNTATASFGGDKTSTFTTSINNSTDLRILKAGPAAVSAGQQITYTIDVTNAGPSSVRGATIVDNVPTAIKNVTWSAAASGGANVGVASGTGNSINITTADIPVGTGAIKLTVTGTVDPAYTGGPLVNTAKATPPANNPDPTLATSTTSTIVNSQPGLQVMKIGPSSVPAGAPISYTVVVTNSGPSDAPNVSIKDIIPAGILNPSWNAVANGAGASIATGAAGTTGTVNVTGSLIAGAGNNITITINGTVDPAQTTSLVNTATATPDGGTTTISSPPVTTAVTNQVGLQIVKSGPATIAAGQAITYTVVVANSGPSNASNINITDLVPSQVQGITWSAVANGLGTNIIGATTGNTNNISLNANIIAGTGNNITITINGTVDPNFAGPLANTTTATGSGGTVVKSVVNTTVTNTPGLHVVKSGPSIINAGQGIVYTVEVTNMGPSNAQNVTISDIVPAQVKNVAWTAVAAGTGANITSPNGGSGTGNTISLIGNIAAGEANKITLNITGTIDPAFTGLITNSATATPAGGTTVPSTPIDTKVNNTPGLHITKSAPSAALANDHITYTVVVSNSGPSNAVGSLITDAVPSGINNVSWKATPSGAAGVTSGGTGTGPNVSVTGDIAAGIGNFITITIDGTIAPNFAGTLSNVAVVTPPGGTPVPTDPSTTVVQRSSDIQVVKSGPSSVAAGSDITYTVDVSNAGPSDVDLLTIADVVPADVMVKNWTLSTISGTNTVFGASSGTGNNINVQTSLSNGGQVRITVQGTLQQTTATSLVNTAKVTLPAGVVDPTPDNTSTVTTAVVQQSGIKVTKTGPQTIHAGETITYVIEAINTGPSDAKGVNVTDIVPSAISNVKWVTQISGAATVNSGTNGIGNNVLVTGDIPNGPANKITILLTGTVDPAFHGTINNVATGKVPTEPNSTNQVTPPVTTTVDQKPVIVITKTGPPTLVAGAPVTYLIQISNTGLSDAKGVVITDQVSAQITGVKWSTTFAGNAVIAAGANGTGNAVSVTGDIPAGSGNTITITVTGTVSSSISGQVSNTATATPAEPGVPPVVTPPVISEVQLRADLSVINTVNQPSQKIGQSVTFTVQVTNNGPSDGSGVKVTDLLPAGYQVTGQSATTGTYDPSSGLWTIGNLPNGASATLTIQATLVVGGPYLTTAVVSGAETDPVLSNNTATAIVAVLNSNPVANPDVNTVLEDQTLTVTAANGLLSNDTDIDNNPLSVSKFTIAGVSGDQAIGTAVLIPGVGTITINADGSYVFIPAPDFNGAVPVLTYFITDGNGGTANSTLTITVTPGIRAVTLSKTGVQNGNQILYTFSVKNTGNITLSNVTITDAGVDAGSISPSSIGILAPGASATVTAKHTLTQGDIDAGSYSNQASTTGTTPGGTPITPVKSDDPNTPAPGDPTVVKVTSKAGVGLVKTGVIAADGNSITYTFVVQNTGNVTLTSAVLNDAKLGIANLPVSLNNGLAPGASVTVTQVYTITTVDKNAGKVTNSANVAAVSAVGDKVTDISGIDLTNDTPTVTVIPQMGGITLVKTGVFSGNQITYTFTIKNTGNVTLNTVTLNDTKLGISNQAVDVGGGLDPGVTVTTTAIYTLTQGDKDAGTVSNTATVKAITPQLTPVTDISGTAENNDTPTVITVPKSPLAVDDKAETSANQPVLIDILGNDNPGSSSFDKGSVRIISQPLHGKVMVNSDGTVTYTPDPGYTGLDSFTYTVKDIYGYVTNVATVSVSVNFFDIKIPNIFTPNGDGINDTFEIIGLNQFGENQLIIVNRWGNEVFRQKNYQNTWTGEGLNEGTYYYLLTVKRNGSTETKVFKGYITLIRAFKK